MLSVRLRSIVAAGVLLGLLAPLGVAASATGLVRTDVIRDYEYWLSEYGIEQAWQVSQGAGVTVAVIDTGIDGSVDELRGVVVNGTDVSGLGSRNGQTPVGSDAGHGTLVASLLAGRGRDDGSGVIGVAPEAKLLSISVGLGASGSRISADDQIAKAVRWAVDNGADVINMSLTRNTLNWPTSWDDAFLYAFEHDVVIVAAAGNRGSGTEEVGAPATIPGVLTVAGVNRDRKASSQATSQGITIGVSAPSEELVGVMPGGGYVRWDGTSAAAPIVSGVVALVRSAFPHLDANNVVNRIIATAQPKGSVPSAIYGYGLLDAQAALARWVPTVSENPMGDLREWVRVHRRADPSTPQDPDGPVEEATPVPLPPEEDSQKHFELFTREAWLSTVIPVALVVGLLVLLTLGMLALLRGFGRGTFTR